MWSFKAIAGIVFEIWKILISKKLSKSRAKQKTLTLHFEVWSQETKVFQLYILIVYHYMIMNFVDYNSCSFLRKQKKSWPKQKTLNGRRRRRRRRQGHDNSSRFLVFFLKKRAKNVGTDGKVLSHLEYAFDIMKAWPLMYLKSYDQGKRFQNVGERSRSMSQVQKLWYWYCQKFW